MARPASERGSAHDRQPEGFGLLRMLCSNALFLHWPVDPALLRPLLPTGLDLDLFDDKAWLTVMPCRLSGLRPVLAPPVPGLSSLLELSVRTCVSHRHEPGVFFFSLDASSAVAVWLARALFHLPYFRATMHMTRRGDSVRFSSRRTHQGATPAEMECSWTAQHPIARVRKGDLAHFLTERRRLYAAHHGRVFVCNVRSETWSLREARIDSLRSSLFESIGLPAPAGAPLAHHADQLALCYSSLQEPVELEAGAAWLDPALSPPATFTR